MGAGDDTAPPEPCPGGCSCRWRDDADRAECGCDGGCCSEEWAATRPERPDEDEGPAAGPRAGDTAPDDVDEAVHRLRVAYGTGEFIPADVAAVIAELARLRSDAAALRAAGNELADEAFQAAQLPTHGNDHRDSKQRLTERADAWQSAAGSPTTDGGGQT